MSVATAAVVATAAAGTAYSAKQQKDAASKARKAGQQDIGADLLSYIQGYEQGLPSVLNMERKYRGDFQNLNLGEINNFLGGDGINLLRLQGRAGQGASQLIGNARQRDLRGMKGDAGIARNLLNSLSPEQKAQVEAATANAAQLRQSAQGLSGQEQRSAEQFAREQGLDSGRIGDNTTLANSLLNRENILAGKRQEANAATESAYNMAGDFYTRNGLGLLSAMPQSYQAGQGLLGIGLGSLGSSVPQLINPDMGVNVGAANRQNQLGAASANAQASAAQNASMMNLLGQGFSSYMQYGYGK